MPCCCARQASSVSLSLSLPSSRRPSPVARVSVLSLFDARACPRRLPSRLSALHCRSHTSPASRPASSEQSSEQPSTPSQMHPRHRRNIFPASLQGRRATRQGSAGAWLPWFQFALVAGAARPATHRAGSSLAPDGSRTGPLQPARATAHFNSPLAAPRQPPTSVVRFLPPSWPRPLLSPSHRSSLPSLPSCSFCLPLLLVLRLITRLLHLIFHPPSTTTNPPSRQRNQKSPQADVSSSAPARLHLILSLTPFLYST